MNKIDFINDIVGTNYVNRGYSMNGCDCFGLVYLYYKHVHGVELELSEEYLNYEDFLTSFTAQLDEWDEVDNPQDGDCCFVGFSDGLPTHCGVMVSKTEVLHAKGKGMHSNGQVLAWKLKTMIRLMGPEVKYYRPRGLNV